MWASNTDAMQRRDARKILRRIPRLSSGILKNRQIANRATCLRQQSTLCTNGFSEIIVHKVHHSVNLYQENEEDSYCILGFLDPLEFHRK